MKKCPELAALATDLCEAIPESETDMRLYLSDMAMYHMGEPTHPNQPIRPLIPHYGAAFAFALQAVEMGWTSRVGYHRDRVASAVRRAGGVLVPEERSARPIITPPQPNRRKDGDSGRVPWDGKQ
jgi:hypothetical protein